MSYYIPKLGPEDLSSLPLEKLRLSASALVVRSKEPFLRCLEGALKKKDERLTIDRTYFRDQDEVFIIPRMDSYHSTPEYREFVDDLKPKILRFMLQSYGMCEEDLPREVCVELFDEFFELESREDVYRYEVLAPFT